MHSMFNIQSRSEKSTKKLQKNNIKTKQNNNNNQTQQKLTKTKQGDRDDAQEITASHILKVYIS